MNIIIGYSLTYLTYITENLLCAIGKYEDFITSACILETNKLYFISSKIYFFFQILISLKLGYLIIIDVSYLSNFFILS